MKNHMSFVLFFITLTACSSNPMPIKSDEKSYILSGQNYTHAIYNQAARLTTHPVSAFYEANKSNTITDVYVVSHGWNYTINDALSMYSKYIDAADKQLAKKNIPNFNPYFIFVVWPSTIKPLTDTVSGILPYGLDEAFKPLFSKIDEIPLHIITTWKQTINAKNIAIGKGYAADFGKVEEIKEPYIVDGNQAGMSFPVSKLIYELMANSDKGGNSYRIHLVGHSYGAKLALLAGAEASRQWAKRKDKEIPECVSTQVLLGSDSFRDLYDPNKGKEEIEKCAKAADSFRPPLESMVLFNAAMTPGEISYQTSFFNATNDLAHLALIPRKAFVYSNTDYANGLLFSVREALTGGAVAQVYEAVNDATNDYVHGYSNNNSVKTWLMLPLDMTIHILSGTASLTSAAFFGVVDYTIDIFANLPLDFLHHVTTHKFADNDAPKNRDDVFVTPLALANAVDYFLPIFPPSVLNRQEDDLGLFRGFKPGLGKTGLVRLGKGRLLRRNLGDLAPFYDDSSDISIETFNKRSEETASTSSNSDDADFWGRDKFFSFNASNVYSSYWPIVGSHGDLRQGETTDDDAQIRKTVKFIINYTKINSNDLRSRLIAE